ncbi:MAG: cation diffusion facilitator family transporter [Patescibacteria group bacterium]
MASDKNLSKVASVSIFAAIITILLKFIAYQATGSVGLFSDALESIVNLLAASFTMIMLSISAKPADDDHTYGHTKAEYFASIVEACFITLASLGIGYAAINRIMHPSDIAQGWTGIGLSAAASLINAGVAFYLFGVAKKHNSLALEADAHHLMTDVWTSVGVIVGIVIVILTGFSIVDPIIALIVALNIVKTGFDLVKRSVDGLMDKSISESDLAKIKLVLSKYEEKGVRFHALRSRMSGQKAFASVHVLVPGNWSVQKGHDMLEELEKEVRQDVHGLSFFTHIEPKEDAKSFEDVS